MVYNPMVYNPMVNISDGGNIRWCTFKVLLLVHSGQVHRKGALSNGEYIQW